MESSNNRIRIPDCGQVLCVQCANHYAILSPIRVMLHSSHTPSSLLILLPTRRGLESRSYYLICSDEPRGQVQCHRAGLLLILEPRSPLTMVSHVRQAGSPSSLIKTPLGHTGTVSPGSLARSLPSQRHKAFLFEPFHPPARGCDVQKRYANPSVPWTTLQWCPLSLENAESSEKGQDGELWREARERGREPTSPVCLTSGMSKSLPRGPQAICGLTEETVKLTGNS